jgi:Protein of unknown function (DUF1353)
MEELFPRDETKPQFRKDAIKLTDLGDGVHFMLDEHVLFYSAELHQTVVAPAGFITDFASTPPGTRNVFPKSGPYNKAAIIHDAGYRLRLQHLGGERYLVNKLEADRLFLEGMVAIDGTTLADGTVLHIPKWKRTWMYRAVRWFGRGEFSKRRPEHLQHV